MFSNEHFALIKPVLKPICDSCVQQCVSFDNRSNASWVSVCLDGLF